MQPLAPLIRKYAEGDDVERSELLAQASMDELRALRTAAAPHWDAINSFLDENMEEIGPRQDLAVRLDAFAQAAMEAPDELGRR